VRPVGRLTLSIISAVCKATVVSAQLRSTMATGFSAPTVGEARATGIKNSGISEYGADVIQPVTSITGAQFTPGKQIEFRVRSSASRWLNWRETKLMVRYKVAFGNETADGAAGNNPPCDRTQLPPNVYMQACANSQLFEAVRLVQNGQTIENQSAYPTCAAANLYTKYSSEGDSSGSNALLTRRKDMRGLVDDDGTFGDGVVPLSELVNPKQAILAMAHDNTVPGGSPFEVAEPLWLASTQHGHYAAANDFQLFLTINQHWLDDLFHSKKLTTAKTKTLVATTTGSETTTLAPAEALTPVDHPAYEHVVQGIPTTNDYAAKTVYVEIESVELLANFVSAAAGPITPPSQSLKFTEMQVTTRKLTSSVVRESIVVPPSVRTLLVAMRQNVHSILADSEEFSKAGAGIDELGLTLASGAGDSTTIPQPFTSLVAQCGGRVVPTQMYSDLDVLHGKMARPYNDALSVVGKPSGLRGVSWDYEHYCGRRSATGQRYPTGCTGTIGSVAASKRVFGDSGPVFMLRLLMPSSSLSNMVEIRGTLAANPAPTAEQHLVVIALHDELLNTTYAPPAELPVKTEKVPII
jgi:hypothetical protein